MKPNPKDRSKSKAGSGTGKHLAVFDKLMKEPAKVTADFVQTVDQRITYDPVRRGALMWLSEPFSVRVGQIHDDRDTAVAFSALAYLLDDSIQRFKGLIELLKAAQIQMELALCVRPDMREVYTEARGNVGSSDDWLEEVARRHQGGEDPQDIINDLKARARQVKH